MVNEPIPLIFNPNTITTSAITTSAITTNTITTRIIYNKGYAVFY